MDVVLCSVPIYVIFIFIYACLQIYLFGPYMILHNLDNQFYIQRLCEKAWDERLYDP